MKVEKNFLGNDFRQRNFTFLCFCAVPIYNLCIIYNRITRNNDEKKAKGFVYINTTEIVFINNPFVQSRKKVENLKIFEKHLRMMNFTVNYIYIRGMNKFSL